MALRIQIIKSVGELGALADEWSALLARSGGNHPFLSPLWLLPWWQVFGPVDGRRLRAVTLRDRGRLVGLAPLLSRRHRYRGVVPFRRLEMMGSGEDEVDEVCSDYLQIIAERGREDEVASAVTRAITGGELGAWDELVIRAADGESPSCAALRRQLGVAGLRVEANHHPDRDAPTIELPASWDHYLAGLSSSRRSFVRRSLRAVERWAGDRLEIKVATTRDQLGRGREVLVALHGQRWRKDDHGGVFASRRFSAFHDLVMPRLADAGALEIFWIEVSGEPLAALYNIVWDNRVYFYQSGRRVDLPPKLRPGIAIHALAIQRAIAAGRREYDFLAGMGEYSVRLSNSRRELVDLRATRAISPAEIGRRAMEECVGRIKKLRRWVSQEKAHD